LQYEQVTVFVVWYIRGRGVACLAGALGFTAGVFLGAFFAPLEISSMAFFAAFPFCACASGIPAANKTKHIDNTAINLFILLIVY
jgi:hypothetical protein